jgi:hypothetical protein
MNAHAMRRETAVSPAFARREMRHPNPYDAALAEAMAEAMAALDRLPETINREIEE